MRHLLPPNQHESDAADARSEIDLRIGAAFTRFQTLSWQRKFEGLQASTISFGTKLYTDAAACVEVTYICVRRSVSVSHAGIHCGALGENQQLCVGAVLGHQTDHQEGYASYLVCT